MCTLNERQSQQAAWNDFEWTLIGDSLDVGTVCVYRVFGVAFYRPSLNN